jgi:autotransporter translocation and assembly factor TamB
MKKALLWTLAIVIGLPLLLLVVISTPPATRFVIGKVMPKVNAQLNGSLTYRSVSGSLLRGLELHGVVLRDPEGEIVLEAERVGVAYSLWDILHKRIRLGPVALDKPVVRLLKSHPGEQYSILRVFSKETGNEKRETGNVDLRITQVTLRDGTIFATIWRNPADPQQESAQQLDTMQLLNVNMDLPLLTYASAPNAPRGALLEIGAASAWMPEPALDLRRLNGRAQLLGDSIAVVLHGLDLPHSHLSADAWIVTATNERRFNASAAVRELRAGDINGFIAGADIPADWTVQGTIRAFSRPKSALVISSPDLRVYAAGGSLTGRVMVVGSDNEWSAENTRIEVSNVEVERLLRAFHIPSDLRATINGEITADGRNAQAALRVQGLAGYGVRGAVNGYVNARGGVDALSLDTRLSGGLGTVALTGDADFGKHLRLSNIRGSLAHLDLAALDARMPKSDLNATLEAEVTFGSMPREGRLKLLVDSSSIRGIPLDTAAVIAIAHEGLLSVDTLLVRAPGLQAKGTGTFGLTEDQNGDLTLTLDSPSLAEMEPLLSAFAGDSVFDVAGSLQARIRAQGSLKQYQLDLEARGSDLAVQGFEAEKVELRAAGTPDSLGFAVRATVDSVTKLRAGGRFSARQVAIDSLSIDRGDATWNLAAGHVTRDSVVRVDSAVLRRSPGPGTVSIDGRFPGDLTLTIRQLPMVDIVPTAKVDSLPTLDGEVAHRGDAWRGSLAMLTNSGERPLTVDFATDPLHGKLTATQFDLATLAPLVTALHDMSGRLDGSVEVAGTTDAPRLTGELRLDSAGAAVPATGVRYHDVQADFAFSGDALRIRSMTAHAGKGSAELTGGVRFARLDQPALDITTRVTRFPLMNRRDFIQATATGEMTLKGSAGGALLRGHVGVDQGTAFLDKFMRTSGIDLADPLYAQFVDTTVLRREALSPGLIEAFIDTLKIDSLSVDLGDNFWLRSPDASIQLGGRLAVNSAQRTNNGDKYELIGTVEAVRGIYRMAFAPGVTREFTIREGSIRYYGSPKTDAALDLSAEHLVKTATGDRVTITAHIGGTMEKPTIGLTSDVTPPLSETELISYLVFGAPTVQAFLGSNESEKRSVFEQSAGQLVGVLSGKLESAITGSLGLPIDYFRIKPGEVQNGLAGTELVLGMQVHILGFPSFLRASPRFCPREQLLSLDHLGIDLETRLAPQWGVATSVDPVQGCESVMSSTAPRPYQFGIDLFWEKR